MGAISFRHRQLPLVRRHLSVVAAARQPRVPWFDATRFPRQATHGITVRLDHASRFKRRRRDGRATRGVAQAGARFQNANRAALVPHRERFAEFNTHPRERVRPSDSRSHFIPLPGRSRALWVPQTPPAYGAVVAGGGDQVFVRLVRRDGVHRAARRAARSATRGAAHARVSSRAALFR